MPLRHNEAVQPKKMPKAHRAAAFGGPSAPPPKVPRVVPPPKWAPGAPSTTPKPMAAPPSSASS
eukprot:6327390-Alexandrium_andersonii.AAC.1